MDEDGKNGLITICNSILRSCTIGWLGGFARYLGSCSAYTAELLGVLEGLRFEKDLGFRAIELHIDFKLIVPNI